MNKQTPKIVTECEFAEFLKQISNNLDCIEKRITQDKRNLLRIINEIKPNKN